MNKKAATVLGAIISPISMRSSSLELEAEPGRVAAKRDRAIFPSSTAVIMEKGDILRLDKSGDIKSFEVLAGSIWLTETPADGDKLLSVGTVFLVPSRAIVIEALNSVKLRLCR